MSRWISRQIVLLHGGSVWSVSPDCALRSGVVTFIVNITRPVMNWRAWAVVCSVLSSRWCAIWLTMIVVQSTFTLSAMAATIPVTCMLVWDGVCSRPLSCKMESQFGTLRLKVMGGARGHPMWTAKWLLWFVRCARLTSFCVAKKSLRTSCLSLC